MAMSEALNRRAYRAVSVTPGEAGFVLRLDDRRAMTPAKAPLEVPTEALAHAIAAEWAAQGERVDPNTMPLTRLAAAALDLVAPRAQEVIDNIAKYAETDLVCYRAEGPRELVRRQHAAWQPLLEWAAKRFGVQLLLTQGIVPLPQPMESLRALEATVAARSVWELAALSLATSALGSLVLALALAEGRLDAGDAFEASVVDESFEIERWGEDAEQMRRRRALRDDVAAAARFLALLRG